MLELGKLTSSAGLYGGADVWLGPGKPFRAISDYTTELYEATLW